jgi:hypothetical protein
MDKERKALSVETKGYETFNWQTVKEHVEVSYASSYQYR